MPKFNIKELADAAAAAERGRVADTWLSAKAMKRWREAGYGRQMPPRMGPATRAAGLAPVGEEAPEKRPEDDVQYVAVDADERTIYVYGILAPEMVPGELDAFFGGEAEVTATAFAAALKTIPVAAGQDLTVRINSPGGLVSTAAAIHSHLADRAEAGERIISRIDGMAASAATLVALAGEKIKAARFAEIMIHWARSFAFGTAVDMRRAADDLERLDRVVLGAYMERVTITEAELRALMDDEAVLPAGDAMNIGLVDSIVGAGKDKEKMQADPEKDDEDEPEMSAADIIIMARRAAAAAADPTTIQAEPPAPAPAPTPEPTPAPAPARVSPTLAALGAAAGIAPEHQIFIQQARER